MADGRQHSEEYRAYLQSPEWRSRRRKVLKRDKKRCACGATARDVHHRTYKNLGHEPLDDLVAVCRACHEAIHVYVDEHHVSISKATKLILKPPAGKRRRRPRKKFAKGITLRAEAVPLPRPKREKRKHLPVRPSVGGGVPVKSVARGPLAELSPAERKALNKAIIRIRKAQTKPEPPKVDPEDVRKYGGYLAKR